LNPPCYETPKNAIKKFEQNNRGKKTPHGGKKTTHADGFNLFFVDLNSPRYKTRPKKRLKKSSKKKAKKARSTPSLWGRRQSGIDAARGWSSEVTSCGRSDLKVGAK
jgi:hypothetical protein